MERRHFIVGGAGMLAAAGMSGAAAVAAEVAGEAARRAVAGEISAAGFSALLNQSFTVHGGLRGATLRLMKVTEAAERPGMRQFSLQFAGDGGAALGTGMHELEHAETGKLMMYLDAQKQGRDAMLYRADFNLLE